jgi:dihydrofolate reductase
VDAADLTAATGSIIAGRRSDDVGRRASRAATSEPYGGAWSGPQFVLTHHPPDDERNPDITFVSGDVGDAVRLAVDAAAGRNVAVLGADVGTQCLARGLVDEICVFVIPVLLGDGVPLYRSHAPTGVRLEQVGSANAGSFTRLHYRVV